MIYVPIKHLKPGMVLARDVSNDTSFFSLLTIGHALTSETIMKLERYGVWGAYIKSRFCDDIEVDEFIDREFKQKAVKDLKRIYDDYSNQKTISSLMIKSVNDLAERLIMQVLSKDECLINIVDIKDHDTYTYTHSMYVGILSVLVGIQLGYGRTALTELAMCGLLHDTGKLDIPIDIINKPDKLTDDEFEIIKTHPTKAIVRLSPCCQLSGKVLAGIGSHHEKVNGTGYPRGLMGDNIPIYGRILALADVYDSLTSCRPYRTAWASSDAIEYMMGCADTHFDHALLQAFLKTVSAYPVGCIVQLSDGRTAVVVKNSTENILRPKVRLLTPENQLGIEVDLAQDFDSLNVIISGTLSETSKLPDNIFL